MIWTKRDVIPLMSRTIFPIPPSFFNFNVVIIPRMKFIHKLPHLLRTIETFCVSAFSTPPRNFIENPTFDFLGERISTKQSSFSCFGKFKFNSTHNLIYLGGEVIQISVSHFMSPFQLL